MTLFEIVTTLSGISESQPAVNSVSEGSIYTNLNANPSLRYYNVNISQTDHRDDMEFDYWGFNIFCTDRLLDDESNRLEIQSTAIETLKNIIRTFIEQADGVEIYDEIIYTTFTQRFTDLCAGAYATVRFKVPIDYICEELF